MELSRRTFSALAGSLALGLALSGSGGAEPASAVRTPTPTGPPPPPPEADGERHRVSLDRWSLLVDGRRLVLFSGEMHYFRLPSPSLWRDVMQKMRAHGYNAVTVPVAWNHHSFDPATYDFSGVRDLDLLLRTAAETQLYVILRPGPYLTGADLDAGGLPGWLTATDGRARSTDPAYLAHADAWLTQVHAIASGHLYTRGRGTVLLYQLEDGGDPGFLAHQRQKARADGIDVPLLPREDLTTTRLVSPAFTDAGADPVGLPWGGPGYDALRGTLDARHHRGRHLGELADGVTVHHTRMAFGGTSWGHLGGPRTYTSYDAAAGLDEGRRPRQQLVPVHELGFATHYVRDLTRLERAADVTAPDPRLTVRHLRNPDTGAQVWVVRNDAEEDVEARLPAAGIDVPMTVPARDARLITTDLRLGGRRLTYATGQLALFAAVGRQDVAVFTGRHGDLVHVVFDCPDEPTATRLDPEPAWVFDGRLLRVTCPVGVGELARVTVENGGSPRPLILLFGDEATVQRLFPRETPSGTVLVYGPSLVRDVSVDGTTVHVTGETTKLTGMEVWGPRGIDAFTWNGREVATRFSATNSVLALAPLAGQGEVPLPALNGPWKRRAENPEAKPDYDDSAWQRADRTRSFSSTPVPEGQTVLFADDYGFHYGDVWYRARVKRLRGARSVSLSYSTGTQGLLMAWLDGEPLGVHRMPVPDASTRDRGTWTATAVFELPEAVRGEEEPLDGPYERRYAQRPDDRTHVLAVLVRRMAHDLDDDADDSHKAARGLTSVTFEGATPGVSWRIQGAGEPDRVRGPLNTGGLHGERHGWHLPEHDDGDWETVELPRTERRQGVTWYRTAFRLGVPKDTDASIGLTLEDDPGRAWRADVFLNGWKLGQYVNDVGPQHTFALPNGILRTRGTNTLALAVLSDGTTPAGPKDVRLTLLGAASGGIEVEDV